MGGGAGGPRVRVFRSSQAGNGTGGGGQPFSFFSSSASPGGSAGGGFGGMGGGFGDTASDEDMPDAGMGAMFGNGGGGGFGAGRTGSPPFMRRGAGMAGPRTPGSPLKRGKNEVPLNVTLEQLYTGVTKKLKVRLMGYIAAGGEGRASSGLLGGGSCQRHGLRKLSHCPRVHASRL